MNELLCSLLRCSFVLRILSVGVELCWHHYTELFYCCKVLHIYLYNSNFRAEKLHIILMARSLITSRVDRSYSKRSVIS